MHDRPRDAADIADADELLRRITPSSHITVMPDGIRILKSFAFREKTHNFSLYVSREITEAKLMSCGYPGQEIISVTAGEVRALGYDLIRDPDQCDASHVYASARAYKSRNQIADDCKALAESVTRRWNSHPD